MKFETRAPKGPWKVVETRQLLRDIYNHAVDKKTEIRVNGSPSWSALVWADVMRNPYPKTAPDADNYSIRINPDYWREFQDACIAALKRRLAGSGVTVRSEVRCTTWLGFNPRLDVAVFRARECERIYECKHIYQLRTGEGVQAITYKALLGKDVTLLLPPDASISVKVVGMLNAASIPVEVHEFRPPAPRVRRTKGTFPTGGSFLGGSQVESTWERGRGQATRRRRDVRRIRRTHPIVYVS